MQKTVFIVFFWKQKKNVLKTATAKSCKRVENAFAGGKKNVLKTPPPRKKTRIANGPPLPHRHQIQTAPTKKNVLKTGRRKKKKRIENGDRREKKTC